MTAFWCMMLVTLVLSVWILAYCALMALRSHQARTAQNHRRSWLGKLLRVSHPEWQGKRVVMPRCERPDLN